MKFSLRLHSGDPCGCERYRYDLAAYREQPGDGLYLPGVKTIIYTAPRFTQRRNRCQQIMAAFGFRDWSFWESDFPYHIGNRLDPARMLRENEPPLLILEDDIEPRDFRACLDIPAGTQLAYLGGGKYGTRTGIRNARQAGIASRRYAGYSYSPINAEWFRPFGMWYTHAILWLDRGAMDECAELWETRMENSDETLGRNQWRWRVACQQIPTFWQNDGHHFEATYDYAPDQNWVRDTILAAGSKCHRRPAFDRRTALRLTRQRILNHG